MSFLETVKTRHSVRRYLTRIVPREAIERCLEAARLAPSACNAQPWKFIVVDDPARKNELARRAFGISSPFNRFAFQAPVLVAVVKIGANFVSAAGSLVSGRRFSFIDVGIAVEHFCLQAAEEGLGTCILGWFNERRVKKFLGVPRHQRVALMLTLGWPAYPPEEAPERKRKEIDKIKSYNRY